MAVLFHVQEFWKHSCFLLNTSSPVCLNFLNNCFNNKCSYSPLFQRLFWNFSYVLTHLILTITLWCRYVIILISNRRNRTKEKLSHIPKVIIHLASGKTWISMIAPKHLELVLLNMKYFNSILFYKIWSMLSLFGWLTEAVYCVIDLDPIQNGFFLNNKKDAIPQSVSQEEQQNVSSSFEMTQDTFSESEDNIIVFLVKVKESESEVTLSCPTLCDPTDYRLSYPSVGFFKQEYWSGLPFS